MRRTLIAGLGGVGLILTLVFALSFPGPVFGQSGTRSRASSGQQPAAEAERSGAGQGGTRQNADNSTKAPYETRLWNWLQQAQYRNWAPPAGVTGEAYAGQSPHGDMVKLYANRTAVATADSLPVGSIDYQRKLCPGRNDADGRHVDVSRGRLRSGTR